MTELVRRSSTTTTTPMPVTKNSSFRIKRIGGNIVVCNVCGQGHEPGKNHLYDYPDNVDETLLCSLCVQALANPVDSPCGHTFCGSCLAEYLRTHRAVCPVDGKTLREKDVKPSSMLVCRLLDRLNVVCPNNAYCDQIMARSGLETHLRLHCAGAYTSCPREEVGCSYVGPRSQLEEHLWNCVYGSDVDKKTPDDVIVLQKDRGAVFGVLICSSKRRPGIYVYNVLPGSVAEGALRIGDRIVQVNEINLKECSPEHASLVISKLVGEVKFKVERVAASIHSSIKTIQLVKEPHEVFGMKVLGGVGSKNGHRPVHVADIRPGGVVDRCCDIQRGDIILSINGISLLGKTYDEALEVLENMARRSSVTMVLGGYGPGSMPSTSFLCL